MVTQGILWTPVHAALTCAVHDEADIDLVLDAASRVLPMLDRGNGAAS
jgi:glutamate-1-semialdehyde aminotransferase